MPKPFHWTLAAFALFCSLLCIFQSEPARAAGVAEYAMIRFDGMEHSQVVWPDGRVEFIGTLAPDAKVEIKNLDERIYMMTIMMNKLSKQGYEFVEFFSPDQVLMKRIR